MRQWRCSVCGYVHKNENPPDKCPVCGADKGRFVLEEDKPSASSSDANSSGKPDKQATSPNTRESSILRLSQQLTRLHAHPIAVHIPNGVLPITVLLALLAWILQQPALATAAKINMVFVLLSMPLVILSGLIDWKNRFKGRMTPVFRKKMICASVVTLLSLILVVWGVVQPNIYTQGSCAVIFLVIYLIDLGAAAIAGWYGGKLVFPKK